MQTLFIIDANSNFNHTELKSKVEKWYVKGPMSWTEMCRCGLKKTKFMSNKDLLSTSSLSNQVVPRTNLANPFS